MNHGKSLGLGVLAALVLMAFASAWVAAATQVCKQVGSGGDGKCLGGAAERELAKGESFTASSTDVVLTSPTTYVSCESSSITLRMISRNSILLIKGLMTDLSFDGCETSGGTTCVTSVANLPYEAVVQNQDVIVSDAANIPMRLDCGFLVSCELIAREQLLAIEGDLMVASTERPLARKGACPVWPRFDASYSAPGITFSSSR
jgi:hypothetical protein